MVNLTYAELPVGNNAQPMIQQGIYDSLPYHRITVYDGRLSFAMIHERDRMRPPMHRGPKSQMGAAIYPLPG